MNKFLGHGQEGQSVVLIALLMVGLVALVGLAIDGGEVYLSRRDAQNASDAAAFAGAQALRGNSPTDASVRSAINRYTQANHVANPSTDVIAYYLRDDNSQSACQIGSCGSLSGYTGVVVTSTIRFQSFFIGIVNGGAPVTIPARARVQSGPPTGSANLMPMTLSVPTGCDPQTTQCFNYGQTYQLFGDPQSPGAFQWVAYNGANDPNTIAQYLYGTLIPPEVHIGDWIPNGPGVQPNSAINAALNWWLAKPESQRHWTIPIYGNKRGSGNNVQYQVIAFGEFVFTGYDFNGNPKYVQGYFVKYTTPRPGTPGTCNTSGIKICAMWRTE